MRAAPSAVAILNGLCGPRGKLMTRTNQASTSKGLSWSKGNFIGLLRAGLTGEMGEPQLILVAVEANAVADFESERIAAEPATAPRTAPPPHQPFHDALEKSFGLHDAPSAGSGSQVPPKPSLLSSTCDQALGGILPAIPCGAASCEHRATL